MIRRILWVLFFFIVLALIALWLLGGGGATVKRTAERFTNPVEWLLGSGEPGSPIRLPWQLSIPQGPDISGLTESEKGAGGQTPEEYAQSYEELSKRAQALQTFGNPSAYRGTVTLSGTAAAENDASKEYVVISASRGNSAPVNITGWSLQSAVTGRRLFIPPASALFALGELNPLEPVSLAPASSATVVSGPSPVSFSFRENICSGYLNELQPFTPELSSSCPAPDDELTQTPDSLRIYGASCFDYARSIPQCHFPANPPSALSAPCRTHLANTYSYNGCIRAHRYDPSFYQPSWRVYLNSNAELWDNSHDIIRLLDREGHTVDVLSY